MSVASGQRVEGSLPTTPCSPWAMPWSEIAMSRVLSKRSSSSILSRKRPNQRSIIVTSPE
jgi:hypothetical protein